ncbi:hypothetical protein ABG768_013137 [Culter alburnus]|uniref:Type III endosome membrane protein TEMP n=1 Tax=Culter alburnus TaxID=194366 RepID=A0AAW2B304_CULAL
MHHRVNMVLITYLVIAMSAHECLTSQEKKATGFANESTGIIHSAWPAGLGALTAVLSIGLLIALAVRYRFFRWCLARNSEHLLLEGETASQFSQAGALDTEIPVRGMRGRMIHGESSDDDEEDGYIEDNYIQASEREREEEEEEVNQQEDAEDSDDELIISEII